MPITQAKGKRRQVRYVDESVNLDDYQGAVRQLIVTGLGHESQTFFLTNDRPERQTARDVIQTYASRNHVENRLGEQITFFHLDCLCRDGAAQRGLRSHADSGGGSVVSVFGRAFERVRSGQPRTVFGSLWIHRAKRRQDYGKRTEIVVPVEQAGA